MRVRWKEYLITVLLWMAVVVVAGYIVFLLFPKQTAKWKQTAEEIMQKTMTKMETSLQAGESKLTSYISSDKRKRSILDQLTPIVFYVEENREKQSIVQENTIPNENSQLTKETGVSLPPASTEAVTDTSVSQLESQVAVQPSSEAVVSSQPPTEVAVSNPTSTEIVQSEPVTSTVSTELAAESSTAAAAGTAAVIVPKITNLVMAGKFLEPQIMDYNYLLNTFYVVDKTTSLPKEVLNPISLLSKNLAVQADASKPQILIYHTHSQEAFADSVPGDVSQTVIGMGDYLTELLTNQYGYQVIHHTGVYDMTDGRLDRNPAYTKALPEITKILEENPSIEVVIDLHRDGVREDLHLVTDINGQPTAKVMLVNGMCRSVEGENPQIPNEYREDNLAFSLQLAMLMKAEYPDLFRFIYTRPSRYNQHLRPRSALIECGAQTNTVQEVRNTIPILADLIHQVLES